MTQRIGFCCKWIDGPSQINGVNQKDTAKEFNTGTTTITWLNRQTRSAAEDRLWLLMKQNLEATRKLVERVGDLPNALRMVRISSDLLPAYTESNWSYFWRQADVRSFADVHIAGRRGPAGIVAALGRLSPEARNLITIENEENAWGLDDCLSIGRDVAIVLDVHHHWVNTGEYIVATDDRVKQVESSWRGVRPTLHYSCSREDILGHHDPVVMPDMFALLESGHKKQKLRAHSNFMWNRAVNMYVSEFWDRFDIQVESKAKNLASHALYEELCRNNLNS